MDSRSLFRKSAILYAPKILTGLFGAAAMATILRNSNTGVYGGYVIVTSFWALIGLLGVNAIGLTMQRHLSISETETPSLTLRLLLIAMELQLGVIVISGLVGLALYIPVMSYLYAGENLTPYIFAGAALFFGNGFMTFYRFSLRGVQMFKTISAMDSAESILRNLFWIINVHLDYGVKGMLIGQALASFIAISLATILSLKHLWPRPREITKGSKALHRKEIVRDSLSFFTISISGYLMFTFPNMIIGKVLGAEAVGLFSGLVKIGETLLAPMTSVGIVFAPNVTRALLKDRTKFNELLTKSFKVILSFLFLIGMVFASSTDIFRFFFQDNFQTQSYVIYAVIIYALAGAVHSTFGVYLDFLGYGKVRSVVLASFCAFNAFVVWFSASHFDIVTTTYAFMSVYLLMVLTLVVIFVRSYSHEFMSKNSAFAGTVIASCLPALTLAKLLSPSSGTTQVFNLIVMMTARSTIYTAIFAVIFLVLNPNLRRVVVKRLQTT